MPYQLLILYVNQSINLFNLTLAKLHNYSSSRYFTLNSINELHSCHLVELRRKDRDVHPNPLFSTLLESWLVYCSAQVIRQRVVELTSSIVEASSWYGQFTIYSGSRNWSYIHLSGIGLKAGVTIVRFLGLKCFVYWADCVHCCPLVNRKLTTLL